MYQEPSFICQVLRAQNMVAAESVSGGQPLPSVLPAPYQNPKSLLKPVNIDDIANESIKKKVQARLHHFEVFKPTRDDTQRFMPRNITKVRIILCPVGLLSYWVCKIVLDR